MPSIRNSGQCGPSAAPRIRTTQAPATLRHRLTGPLGSVGLCGDRLAEPLENIRYEKIRGCSYREATRPTQYVGYAPKATKFRSAAPCPLCAISRRQGPTVSRFRGPSMISLESARVSRQARAERAVGGRRVPFVVSLGAPSLVDASAPVCLQETVDTIRPIQNCSNVGRF